MGDVSLIIRVLFSWLVFLSQQADAQKGQQQQQQQQQQQSGTTKGPQVTQPPQVTPAPCPNGKYFAHPNSCQYLYQCINGKTKKFKCPNNLWWTGKGLSCTSPWGDKICKRVEKVVMCHFHQYAYTRELVTWPPMLFLAANVEYPCTHLVYGQNIFIDDNKINLERLAPEDQRVIADMKRKPGPHRMKTLLSVKLAFGWDFDIEKFALNAQKQLRAKSFDGIEIDSGHNRFLLMKDKNKFTQLLKTLRQMFKDEARRSRQTELEISVTVYPRTEWITSYYDVTAVSTYANYVVVNAMHTDWGTRQQTNDPHAIEPSPLNTTETTDHDRQQSQVESVSGWLNNGLPRNKLILPFTTYAFDPKYCLQGKIFTNCFLYYGDNKDLWTLDNGVVRKVPYFELCRLQSYDYKPSQVVDGKDLSQYLHPGPSVPYENATTVLERVEYIKDQGLKGTKVYFLQFDDHSNRCGEGRYPLTNLAFEQLTGRKVDMEPKIAEILAEMEPEASFLQTNDSVTSSLSALVVLMVICVHWVAGH